MRRLVVLGVGAGLLLAGLPPVAAATRTADAEPVSTRRAEREALTVLERAVRAGIGVDYRGTQYVASWRDSRSDTALVDVTHRPGQGSVVREAPRAVSGTVPAAATAALDPRLVRLLAASYDLAVAGPGRCTGRTTSVVEARRDGQVAGRFWVDDASGLLLRREVYDDRGRRLRSSAFVDLEVRTTVPAAPAEPVVSGMAVADAADALRRQGWQVPDRLPGGFRLFDTRLSTPRAGEHVLHLAYSDGLSTTSLFAQSGRLGTAAPDGFEGSRVRGRPVWVRHDSPERVVWSGGGHVWTLVSDAPLPTVRSAVAALPRDPAPQDGLRARLGRGLSRLAGLLDPFS